MYFTVTHHLVGIQLEGQLALGPGQEAGAVQQPLADRAEALEGPERGGAWGERGGRVRAPADVDLVIWVDDDRLDVAFDLLRKAGARLEPEQARAEARDRGMFVCHVEGVRVDVFVPSIPFYAAARSRRVRTAMAGRDTWVHPRVRWPV